MRELDCQVGYFYFPFVFFDELFLFVINHNFQLWQPLGLVGALGAVAVEPVVAG